MSTRPQGVAHALGPLLALALLVLLVRAVLVGLFAGSMPFWDQWDAEAAYLLKPWVDGEWSAWRLFDAHNEHRIAFTRALSLLLFEANGGRWDNLVSALANTGLSAGAAALLFGLLRGGLPTRAARAGWFLVVLGVAALPFSWENLLVGFQSQFQFLGISTLLALAAASRLPDRFSALPWVWVPALLGLFTMATGVLAPVAAGGVLTLRAWLGQLSPRVALPGVAGLAVIAIAGYLAVPAIPGHQALRPDGLGQGLAAFLAVLSWPMPSVPGIFVLLWCPSLVFLWRLWRERQATPSECLALGLAAWAVLQAFAIAYSRGQGLQAPPSRYTDLLALGLAANAWFAIVGASRIPRGQAVPSLASRMVLGLSVGAMALGLWRGLPADGANLRERARLSQVQTGYVQAFLASGDTKTLVAPPMHIPYPDPARLASLLSDPTVRSILPPPLSTTNPGALGRFAHGWQRLLRDRWTPLPPANSAGVRTMTLPVRAGDAVPFQLVAGITLEMDVAAPDAGQLLSAGVLLGTYARRLEGVLTLRACAAGDCVAAAAELTSARDNEDLVLVFDRPLATTPGETLTLEFGARGTGHPVAVWLLPAPEGAAPLRVTGPEGSRAPLPGRRPRLVLGYRQ